MNTRMLFLYSLIRDYQNIEILTTETIIVLNIIPTADILLDNYNNLIIENKVKFISNIL